MLHRMLAFAAILLLSAAIAAEEPVPDIPERPFEAGEHLLYDLTWMGIAAGQATISLRGIGLVEGRPVYQAVSSARSNDFISSFYEVRDTTVSFFDVETLHSWRFEKHLNEGGNHKSEYVVHDRETNTATFYRHKDDELKKRRVVETPGPVHDPLSAVYYLRTVPLNVGEEVSIDVCADKKNSKLVVAVKEKTTLDLGKLGKVKAILVEPRMEFEGIFVAKADTQIRIWLEEGSGVPLKLAVDIPIGAITATLVERRVVPDPASVTIEDNSVPMRKPGP